MKIRIFSDMVNGVYRITLLTEDWSQGDVELMVQYGEPEVNVGGSFEYLYEDEPKTKDLGDQFVRLLHGFPFSIGFDSRDYDGEYGEAEAAGNAWKDKVVSSIRAKVATMRSMAPLSTEEVVNDVQNNYGESGND